MSATGDAEKTAVEQPPADAPPAEQPAEKPAKEKKPKAPKEKKPKAPKTAAHPPYFEMIKEALVALNEKSGSSPYAIAKFVEEKHKSELPANFRKILGLQLKNSAARGKLIKIKASYKLSEAGKKVPAVKKPAKANAETKRAGKPAAQSNAKTTRATAAAKKKTEAVKAKPEKKVTQAKKTKKAAAPAKAKQPKSIKSPAAKRARKAAAA
ncbi:histone H1 [Coffea eugenioides]|uniref:Histone H1-like n=1 Tax=Coffea arabica TaxID=13443 RepID=A0ABM4V7J2_COFAR|nr:histone H1-like [Coffea arabica]XP_027078740.1 histone H1-like [Coffea arabica]XP_027178320.1 histone H1 [Coffea eugenioides]